MLKETLETVLVANAVLFGIMIMLSLVVKGLEIVNFLEKDK